MKMLAKAREEIIYLRSKNNRQRSKYDDLQKQVTRSSKKNEAIENPKFLIEEESFQTDE